MPRADTERGERLATTALGVAMALSALSILVLGRDLTFWSDELDWLTAYDGFGVGELLNPHNSHLIATTRVIYEGLPRIFGTDYLPFRILGIVCLQAGAVLTFVLVRRRMGAVVAVFPAIILLFFGSAQDMTMSPLGIPFTLSIALGLGALALVEQNGLRTDLAAMLLLVLAELSHSFGTIVAGGILVYLILERGRRREIWIAIVPLALWVAWWIWAQQFDQGITESSNILGLPLFVLEAAGAAIQGALGIPVGSEVIGDTVASLIRVIFSLIALAAIVVLAVRLRRGPTGPWAWAYVVTIFAFWIGVGLSEGDGREPATPRYLYFGATMIFLILAELMRGREVPSRAVRPLLALFAFSLICNVALMVHSVSGFNDDAAKVRAEIAVVGFDSDYLDQSARLGDLDVPGAQVPSSPGALADFEEDVGSTGFTLDELLAQPEEIRLGADLVLVRALQIVAGPVPAPVVTGDCESYSPGSDGYTSFPLDGGLNAVLLAGDRGDPGSTLSVGRYADTASVPVGELTAGGAVAVLVPDDDVPRPWMGRAAGRIDVCPVVIDESSRPTQ